MIKVILILLLRMPVYIRTIDLKTRMNSRTEQGNVKDPEYISNADIIERNKVILWSCDVLT